MNIVNRRHFLGIAALVLTFIPQVSAEQSVQRPTAAAEVWVQTELYFGTSKLNGEVTDAEFSAFVDLEVTKRSRTV